MELKDMSQAIRAELEISHYTLAEAIGTTQGMVSKIENGLIPVRSREQIVNDITAIYNHLFRKGDAE